MPVVWGRVCDSGQVGSPTACDKSDRSQASRTSTSIRSTSSTQTSPISTVIGTDVDAI